MRLPNAEHERLPWRIHALVPDFTLEDVWTLPTPGAREDFDELLELLGGLDPAHAESGPTRLLWNFRDSLGRWFDLGEVSTSVDGPQADALPIPGEEEVSLRHRLPPDLASEQAPAPSFGSLPFIALYRTEDEAAAEVSNKTMHGVAHLSWVDAGHGCYEGRLAVYVKTRGIFGRSYMAAIKPFRHWIVYPALMQQIAREWRERL
ncbi:MAG TPA: DUF2867 domain-containing protein [Solirubrobacterales bacterium]|nr:DUF2867 domain-containing protein [Solirubrobacterales bacterium]